VALTVVYLETAPAGLRRLRRENKAAFAIASNAIATLAADPHPDGAVVWGDSGIRRLHAGNVRILYEVDRIRRLSTSSTSASSRDERAPADA
jgi:mRNA-degrading endonuclease RelE of RelBE toxin-antitoxin system